MKHEEKLGSLEMVRYVVSKFRLVKGDTAIWSVNSMTPWLYIGGYTRS